MISPIVTAGQRRYWNLKRTSATMPGFTDGLRAAEFDDHLVLFILDLFHRTFERSVVQIQNIHR